MQAKTVVNRRDGQTESVCNREREIENEARDRAQSETKRTVKWQTNQNNFKSFHFLLYCKTFFFGSRSR